MGARPGFNGDNLPGEANEPRAFTYRVIAPPLWALVGIMAGELIVVHLILAHWTIWGAMILSVLSLGIVGWEVFGLLSMPRMPVLVGRDVLVMRAGRIKGARVPIAQVRGLRREWDSAALKQRGVLNLALVSYPNILIDLTAPLPGRRRVTAIAHRLDDPVGFADALQAALTVAGQEVASRPGAAV